MHRLAICRFVTTGFQLLPVLSVCDTDGLGHASSVAVDELPEFPGVIRHIIALLTIIVTITILMNITVILTSRISITTIKIEKATANTNDNNNEYDHYCNRKKKNYNKYCY